MEPKIQMLKPKMLVGVRNRMSMRGDTTRNLWSTFMPRRSEVRNRVSDEYISMQVYEEPEGVPLTDDSEFDKWAVVEVSKVEALPEGMETYNLAGGLYAVFLHEGPARAAPKTFQYIFGQYLPNSDYEVDSREHFEVLREGYDPDDPGAREFVWVPIRERRDKPGT